jgi:haloalkane dehalogenase
MGWSDKPPLDAMPLSQHTANLVEFIERLDLRNIVMVVHDWGGAIGLGAAVQLPSRFAGLVVLNTAAFPPPYVPLRIAVLRTPCIGRWAMTHGNVFARAATKMTLHRLDRLAPEVERGLLQPYDTPLHRVGIANFVRDIPLSKRHPTHATLMELESKLPTLKHLPIRLVWGMRDWCFRPSCLERFQALWPDAKTVPLQDVGHYVMEEAPEDVVSNVQSILAGIENGADFD